MYLQASGDGSWLVQSLREAASFETDAAKLKLKTPDDTHMLHGSSLGGLAYRILNIKKPRSPWVPSQPETLDPELFNPRL